MKLRSFAVWIVAIGLAGCGGGGGGGGTGNTTRRISSIVPVGPAVPTTVNAPWTAQFLSGHKVLCGVFSGQPGMYFDGSFRSMPQSIPGATNYVPLFMAGKLVYGSDSLGNVSWNSQTNSIADTGDKQAVAVSPSGTFVAFETAGTASILNVSTNTEFALPVSAIQALSDSGSGACVVTAGNATYRFSASGSISKSPLQGGSSSQTYTIQAANPDGLLAGDFGGFPGLWRPGTQSPLALGIPGGKGGHAQTMNVGGAVGGWYQATAGSGRFALLWPVGSNGASVFVDVNAQFPLPNGAVLNGVYALDPNSLNFIGLITNADGTQSIQTFAVH